MTRATRLSLAIVMWAALIVACNPTVPTPVQPVQTIQSITTPTIVQIAQATSALPSTPVSAATNTPAPIILATVTPQPTISPSPTVLPPTLTPTPCSPPPQWVRYTVQAGDTLFSVAAQVNLTQDNVIPANCLTSSDLTVGQVLYLPSIPCTPTQPAGWTLYTIRSGDTLFSLATTRGISVDDVKRVNCLSSSDVRAGSSIYLPQLALPAAPTSPPQPPVATSCPSAFSCSNSSLPPVAIAPGGPNESGFNPCESIGPQRVETSQPLIVELGEQRYFFACDFPSAPTSASVILSDGSVQPVAVLDPATVDRDLIINRAQAVIGWAALPTHPNGVYTVTIADSNGDQAQLEFLVKPPTKKHILVVPHAGTPGTTFQVYYVNFDLNMAVTFDFYGEDQPTIVRGLHTLSYRGQWTILITEPLPGSSDKGWAQAPLVSAPTDLRAAYSITYNQLEIYTLFRLQ